MKFAGYFAPRYRTIRRTNRRRVGKGYGRALRLEPLEDRRLLAIVTWDGGGLDNLWTNPLNWDSAVPTATDDVVFNGSLGVPSSKNAWIDPTAVTVNSLTVTSGYTGVIVLGDDPNIVNTMTVTVDATIAGRIRFDHANSGVGTGDVLDVKGKLTLDNGAVLANDNNTGLGTVPLPAPGNNNGATPITVLVGSDMLMKVGSEIRAENEIQAGFGGLITITVGGNFKMEDQTLISSSKRAGSDGGAAAGNIIIDVTCNADMQGSSSILAEQSGGPGPSGGDGGNISFTVGGDLTMDNGSVISSSKLNGAGDTGDAGDITIDVGGNVELEIGSTIAADGTGPAGDIEITVDGNFTMHGTVGPPPAGALISSVGGSGVAGDITIEVAGDVLTEGGSRILADGLSAGAILITGTNLDIDGTVSSRGTRSGSGNVATQGPGGGTITIKGKSTLTISDTGIVSSKGQDPGADLVHLEACKIFIFGLVESTGVGHALPANPPNHLNDHGPPIHPAMSTAGIEIWAGQFLIIDSTGSHKGQVNADLTAGATKRSWIDLFAVGDITIIGDTVNPFAVHATNSGSHAVGGQITVISTEGKITAGGLAFDASANTGSDAPTGGVITIEAFGNVDLDTATILARGDFVEMGGYGSGGTLSVRSYNGSLSWEDGLGDVRPTGIDPPPPPTLLNPGTIVLTYKTTVSVLNTQFPTGGSVPNSLPPFDPPFPDIVQNISGGAPTVPDYVEFTICRTNEFDFGDAPENPIVPGDYPTTLANDGARHIIVADFHLGDTIDAETDGQPNGTATGDDDNPVNTDDEDGVTFNGPFVPGLNTSITVEVTDPGGLAGNLSAWFDWNGDGDWLDTGEQEFTDLGLADGTHNLTVSVPLSVIDNVTLLPSPTVVSVAGAPTFARFRFSTATGLASTGEAPDGEVEDYKLFIFPYWTSKCAVITQIGECFAIPDVLVDVDDLSLGLTVDPNKVGTLAPATRSIQAAIHYVNANGDVNGDGKLLVAVTAKDTLVESAACGGIPFIGRDLGGDGFENFVVTNPSGQQLYVMGNSVEIHAADPTKAVATIKSSVGKVTYMDIHGLDSNVAGIKVGGATTAEKNKEAVLVKNTSAQNNVGGIGIWVQDDKVEVSGSQHVSGNKIGIQIDGDYNTLRTNNEIMNNSGLGIKVTGKNNQITDQDVGKSGNANGGGGIEVAGDSNTVKDSEIAFNTGAGIKVTGKTNTVDGNEIYNNTLDAIWSSGSSNKFLSNDIFSNGGDGIEVTGDSNTIQKNLVGDKSKGNGGDGIRVVGKSNQILENEIYANWGDGIELAGDSNTIKKNKVGDKSKGGNGLGNLVGNRDGVRITGKTNLLEENTVNANKGYGIFIAGATSTGNKLKNNKSNTESPGSGSENALAEYKFEAAITNQGGNKKDNANFTATAVGTFE